MGDPSADWEGGLPDDDFGCRYILDSNKACGAPRKDGFRSYCAEHHALCHLTPAQVEEREREIEALARAVGGRMPARRIFSVRELQRIEGTANRE